MTLTVECSPLAPPLVFINTLALKLNRVRLQRLQRHTIPSFLASPHLVPCIHIRRLNETLNVTNLVFMSYENQTYSTNI